MGDHSWFIDRHRTWLAMHRSYMRWTTSERLQTCSKCFSPKLLSANDVYGLQSSIGKRYHEKTKKNYFVERYCASDNLLYELSASLNHIICPSPYILRNVDTKSNRVIVNFINIFRSCMVSYFSHVLSIWRNKVLFIICIISAQHGTLSAGATRIMAWLIGWVEEVDFDLSLVIIADASLRQHQSAQVAKLLKSR